MKVANTLKFILGMLMVSASFNAWPQASVSSSTTAPASTAEPSAKAARQANRALSKKVLQALSKGGVSTSRINVIAKGGQIALAGSVSDASQIDKAAQIAATVPGVTSVKNSLTFKEVGQ
ncbi:BON domain-containing protein [Paraburkholderia bengalensis]|uniref:BON domain-containing protein n=1 Tax=Paraburkholderia bengalensis TaxID=2747562 RepID=A0ABU8J295_9BURK